MGWGNLKEWQRVLEREREERWKKKHKYSRRWKEKKEKQERERERERERYANRRKNLFNVVMYPRPLQELRLTAASG